MTALVALGPSDLRLDLKTAALYSRRYYYYKLVSSFQFPVLKLENVFQFLTPPIIPKTKQTKSRH